MSDGNLSFHSTFAISGMVQGVEVFFLRDFVYTLFVVFVGAGCETYTV